MFRQTAGRIISTASTTGAFVVRIPVGIARSVLERVVPHADSRADSGPAPQRAGDVAEPATTTADPQQRAGAGDLGGAEEGPDVVLAVDSPPEVIEPPVDVVGEALKAEQEQVEPPAEVDDEVSVVYSTSSDER